MPSNKQHIHFENGCIYDPSVYNDIPKGSTPLPPVTERKKTTYTKQAKRPGKHFAAKQVLIFMGMVFIIVTLDFFLYLVFSIAEFAGSGDDLHNPSSYIWELKDQLSEKDGQWSVTNPDTLGGVLEENDWWALIINKEGTVTWSERAPLSETATLAETSTDNKNIERSIPTHYSLNDIALINHYQQINRYPIFVAPLENDNLLVLGTPRGSYWIADTKLPHDAMLRIPLYLVIVLLLDTLIVYLLYTFSKHTVLRNIEPALKALDDLSQERPVNVHFDGPLQAIGNKINSVSNILQRKEQARKNWIAGVSHDVRTPLAVIMGHAERISTDPEASSLDKQSGALIVQQTERIRDLIEDLNIASHLEYDMQPLRLTSFSLSRLIRSVVTDYLNRDTSEAYTFEIIISPEAEQTSFLGDERLIARALHNAINNAVKHNETGCTITVSLTMPSDHEIELSVCDDGVGCSPAILAHLQSEIALARQSILQAESSSATSHASQNPTNPIIEPPLLDSANPFATSPFNSDTATPLATPLDGLKQHGLGVALIARIVFAHGGQMIIRSAPLQGFGIVMTWNLDTHVAQ